MKSSCIQHPQNDRFIQIRDWQMIYCIDLNNSAKVGASILSYFEFFHNIRISEIDRKRSIRSSFKPKAEDYLQNHSYKSIEKGIKGIGKRNTIIKCLDFLKNSGAINVIGIANGYEYEFLFKEDHINQWLRQIYPHLKKDGLKKTQPKKDTPHLKKDTPPFKKGSGGVLKRFAYIDTNIDTSIDNNKILADESAITEIVEEGYIPLNTFQKTEETAKKTNVLLKAELDSKKEKISAKKEKSNFVKSATDYFDTFYLKEIGIKYIWANKDFGSLKNLQGKLVKSYKKGDKQILDPTDQELLKAFDWLCTKAISDEWIKANFSVSILVNQYNKLLNPNNAKGKSKSSNDFNKQRSAIREAIAGKGI